MESKKYRLNAADGTKIMSALFWSLASTAIGFFIVILPSIDVPAQYIFVIPMINGLLYTLKRFVDGQD